MRGHSEVMGKGWFPFLRFYGPTEPYFGKPWKLEGSLPCRDARLPRESAARVQRQFGEREVHTGSYTCLAHEPRGPLRISGTGCDFNIEQTHDEAHIKSDEIRHRPEADLGDVTMNARNMRSGCRRPSLILRFLLAVYRSDMKSILIFGLLLAVGCTGIPVNVKPVADFKAERYLGKWYEIARLDHGFERELSKVTAEYSMREDGGIRVVNRGLRVRDQQWKQVEGKAYFVKGPDTGHLKVSFFGPFYGSYVVIALDQENYRYSLVCGFNRSYLWLLAREPTLDPEIQTKLLSQAAALGFATDKLIFTEY
jgi:apolipoprotein D and lipocalin family protein